jgi:hypothetical protein
MCAKSKTARKVPLFGLAATYLLQWPFGISILLVVLILLFGGLYGRRCARVH